MALWCLLLLGEDIPEDMPAWLLSLPAALADTRQALPDRNVAASKAVPSCFTVISLLHIELGSAHKALTR
jgi:hypothetical protein